METDILIWAHRSELLLGVLVVVAKSTFVSTKIELASFNFSSTKISRLNGNLIIANGDLIGSSQLHVIQIIFCLQFDQGKQESSGYFFKMKLSNFVSFWIILWNLSFGF